MKFTSELGLSTAETSIENFENQRALVVRRFDRKFIRDGQLLRASQEDCCQALSFPHTMKYQRDGGPDILSILEFLKASDDPQRDQKQFIKTQIVFWLMGATDGHAKNFSVFLYPGGGFRLTPLYDVMSTQPLLDAGQLRGNQMRLRCQPETIGIILYMTCCLAITNNLRLRQVCRKKSYGEYCRN